MRIGSGPVRITFAALAGNTTWWNTAGALFLGEQYVNVVTLNLALDKASPVKG